MQAALAAAGPVLRAALAAEPTAVCAAELMAELSAKLVADEQEGLETVGAAAVIVLTLPLHHPY